MSIITGHWCLTSSINEFIVVTNKITVAWRQYPKPTLTWLTAHKSPFPVQLADSLVDASLLPSKCCLYTWGRHLVNLGTFRSFLSPACFIYALSRISLFLTVHTVLTALAFVSSISWATQKTESQLDAEVMVPNTACLEGWHSEEPQDKSLLTRMSLAFYLPMSLSLNVPIFGLKARNCMYF